MFTILWNIGDGREEIYLAHSVSKTAAAPEPSDDLDCHGAAHIAFQALTAVEGDSSNLHLARTLISAGDVFVMNGEGKTVATYRFGPEAARIAA